MLFQSLQDFEREPDVASDFFGMCIRYIKLHKSLLFRSQHLPALIKVWSLGIGIEQSNAVETHTEFFNTLVKVLSKDIQTIQDISNPEQVMNSGLDQNEILLWNLFIAEGQNIVQKYVDVILAAPSKSVVYRFVDVLVEVALEFPVENKRLWFSQAFKSIPGDVLTEEEKCRQLEKICMINPKPDRLIENFDIIAKRARNSALRQ